MATNTAIDLGVINNADGFELSGGNTNERTLSLTGADVDLVGSGTNTQTFPSSSQTLVGRSSTDTLTNKTIEYDDNTVTSKICADASLTSAQNVTSGSFQKIQLGNENFDPNSNFDSSTNYRYTAPVSGKYLVTAALTYGSVSAAGRYILAIYKNGSAVIQMEDYNPAGTYPSASVTRLLSLNATDYIELYTFQNSGSTQSLAALNATTYLSIMLYSK